MGTSSTAFIITIHLLALSNFTPIHAVDFLFNSFKAGDLNLVGDARVDSSVIRLTNDSKQLSIGRAFFPTKLTMSKPAAGAAGNTTVVSSFSTPFVFSVLPVIASSPGFGLAFVLSNSTTPPGAISGQYFGLFSNSTRRTAAPLLAVEFDTGQNTEFGDPDGNHVGIDLNYIESSINRTAGYYRPSSSSSSGGEEFVPIDMRSGRNVRVWIEFDGPRLQINVTLAPAEEAQKPRRPLISYSDPQIESYIAGEMFVGFSASKVKWVEAQRVLAWSLSDTGRPAREINTTNLPVFLPPSSSSTSAGLIVGVTIAAVAVAVLCSGGIYYYFCCYLPAKKKDKQEQEEEEEVEVEEWEVSYWPHRFSYEELRAATKGFSREQLLGYGGFGKVYKGVLPKSSNSGSSKGAAAAGSTDGGGGGEEKEVAVKCVSHDSKQGLREFMAEISSMGRLRHKNLTHMRGWCRKGNELMLVYDYMPNGSLNRWIFPPTTGSVHGDGGDSRRGAALLGWEGRRRVLGDVAEGLSYLHHGWEQRVLHRDVKSSNILLDGRMRGRLGDFGLAKLYHHGEVPGNTRVVGTLGYLAPELAHVPGPTSASDVYSFGVVVLEVACGRRPIEPAAVHGGGDDDDDVVLVDWVRVLYADGRLAEAADGRIEGEYRAEKMELVLKLGLACCHPDPEQRPSMKEVVEVLVGEGNMQQQQQPPPQSPDLASDATTLGEGKDESPLMSSSSG